MYTVEKSVEILVKAIENILNIKKYLLAISIEIGYHLVKVD
ncbi:hypothetical protein [Clostridium thermarum]|nr:hypothetical protein [Clostridium thermarum]